MFSGIPREFANIATRVKTTYADEIGNTRTGIGTGFWYTEDNFNRAFITNRHNLDPKLNPYFASSFQLKKIEIELRQINDDDTLTEETDFFEIQNYLGLFHSEDADVSLIHLPQFRDTRDQKYQHTAALHGANESLADDDFFTNKLNIMDSCCFMGFPGSTDPPEEWWDQRGNFPIARNGSIASRTDGNFCNKAIITKDTILISGMSFSGSSGSPVFSFQKGLKGVVKMAGNEDEN